MIRPPDVTKSRLIVGLGLTIIIAGILPGCSISKRDNASEWRERSRQILRTTLSEGDPFARAAAAKAMGDSGDPVVLPWLSVASKDSDATVRLFTVEASSHFGPQTAIRFIESAMLDRDSSVRLTAVRVLSELKSGAPRPLLVKVLKDDDADVQLLGLGAVVGIQGMESHPDTLARYDQALRDKNPEVRVMAAAGLGKTGDVRSLPLLSRALKDPDASVRSYAAQALADLNTVHAIPLLSEAVNEPDAGVRSQAALALGVYNTPDVLLLLQQAAQDGDPMVRLSGAASLAKQNDPRAMELFRSALADSDYGIRSAAARTMGEIARSGGLNFGKDATKLLVPLLEDPSARVRSATARALGMFGRFDALPALTRELTDVEPSVRCYASGAVLRILNERERKTEMQGDGSNQASHPHPSVDTEETAPARGPATSEGSGRDGSRAPMISAPRIGGTPGTFNQTRADPA